MDRRIHLTLLVTLVSSACASAHPAPTRSHQAPAGEYSGSVTIETVAHPASLSVIPGQDEIRTVLLLNDGTVAFGIAEWLDGVLFMGFDYGRNAEVLCEGRMLLTGVPDGRRLSLRGGLQSKDCTGVATGDFELALISAAPELGAPR